MAKQLPLLSLRPNLLVITNIAYDHPDCYQSIDEVKQAFVDLTQRIKIVDYQPFGWGSKSIIKIGRKNYQLIIIDDYGHHPDQIKAVIQAVRDVYPPLNNKIIAVFEPHQYERTWRLFDQLILLPVYFVKGRESKEAMENVNLEKLAGPLSDYLRKNVS